MEHARNRFEFAGFVLGKLASPILVQSFDCGDNDLNDYFHNDCANYRAQLLTQTYCVYAQGGRQEQAVALVDFCNDGLARRLVPNRDLRNIHHAKRGYRMYPAVKITRLGVDRLAQGQHLGTLVLQMTKLFFLLDNRCGCRFLTVDAYLGAVPFYEKCGFVAMRLSAEELEGRHTIPLFSDLKRVAREDD